MVNFLNPGNYGYDRSSNSWDRTNYLNAQVFSTSGAPVLIDEPYKDGYQFTVMDWGDNTLWADSHQRNREAVLDINNAFYRMDHSYDAIPFNIDWA